MYDKYSDESYKKTFIFPCQVSALAGTANFFPRLQKQDEYKD